MSVRLVKLDVNNSFQSPRRQPPCHHPQQSHRFPKSRSRKLRAEFHRKSANGRYRSIISGGGTPARAFLNDVLLENHRFKSSSQSVDVLLGLLVHIVILGGPIFAGLYYTETINLKEFTTTFLVAPSPPPPAPPPAAAAVKSQAPKRVFISEGKLLAPTYIPNQVAQIKEARLESDAFAGVLGGVPGGIPGGRDSHREAS
jgi:hypothetical protein